jgi:hypothetical protein
MQLCKKRRDWMSSGVENQSSASVQQTATNDTAMLEDLLVQRSCNPTSWKTIAAAFC